MIFVNIPSHGPAILNGAQTIFGTVWIVPYPSVSSFLSLVVADVMTTEWVHVEAHEPIAKLRQLFHIHEFNAMPVMRGGGMCGWVSQYDVLKPFVYTEGALVTPITEILQRPVETVMVTDPESVATTDSLAGVLRRMVESRHPSYPVIDSAKLVGIIARDDILQGLDKALGWV